MTENMTLICELALFVGIASKVAIPVVALLIGIFIEDKLVLFAGLLLIAGLLGMNAWASNRLSVCEPAETEVIE